MNDENLPADLDALAQTTFERTDTLEPNSATQAGAEADQAQTTAALDATVAKVAFGLLRAARTLIGRKLPEIHAEWSDDVLRGPADALPPVMRRYAGTVSDWAGRYPELFGLGLSVLPMLMGYVAAVEKHAMTVTDAAPKPAPAPGPLHAEPING